MASTLEAMASNLKAMAFNLFIVCVSIFADFVPIHRDSQVEEGRKVKRQYTLTLIRAEPSRSFVPCSWDFCFEMDGKS